MAPQACASDPPSALAMDVMDRDKSEARAQIHGQGTSSDEVKDQNTDSRGEERDTDIESGENRHQHRGAEHDEGVLQTEQNQLGPTRDSSRLHLHDQIVQ